MARMMTRINYYNALDLFKDTPEVLEALRGLDTSEKAGFRMELYLDDVGQTAQYRIGHANMSTPRITQLSESQMITDNYVNMKSWAQKKGLKFELV